MKVAVCISGLPRSGRLDRDITLNFDSVRKKFIGADFFFGTWESHHSKTQQLFPDFAVQSLVEPNINYHPYIDAPSDLVVTEKLRKMIHQSQINSTLRDIYLHQTKQIIAHAMMVESLPTHYDIIIRARYDTFVSTEADFTPYINDCFSTKRAIGFAWVPTICNFNDAKPVPKDSQYCNRFLFDQLIINRKDMIEPLYIFELSKNKRLLPAEFGWWQVLSEPYGNNHLCMSGWANPDKSIDGRFLS